jgi:hypothetical protein
MKQCSAISGFDWEDPLKVRCRVVSDQINAARAKTGAWCVCVCVLRMIASCAYV